jgi:hypothetical protein
MIGGFQLCSGLAKSPVSGIFMVAFLPEGLRILLEFTKAELLK